jgi:transposase
MRQTLLTEFRQVLRSVKNGSYPYHPREPTPIPWHRYDVAQTNELPEVISLMGRLIDAVNIGMPAGRGCADPKANLAKLILAQQYDGRCNRNSIGLLSLMGEKLGIPSTRNQPSYKALERAYDDPALIGILSEVFFLTQRPVSLHEERFAVDGTCFAITIKENWESAKRRFLKKPEGRSVFEKTVIACGTTFKIIAAFAVAATPYANDSPYLKPILSQIGTLYHHVNLIAADPAFLSRENCASIAQLGAKPRIMPKGNVSMKAKGVKAWRDMLIDFTQQMQRWLRNYHRRSIAETVSSTMKRVNPTPLRKKLIIRRAVEILARICVYKLRQLTYLKYTRNIQLGFDTPTPN